MESWDAVLSAALLGAQRSPLQDDLHDLPLRFPPAEAAERLLAVAAAAAVYRRAGRLANALPEVKLNPAPDDPRPTQRGPAPGSVDRLYQMGFLQEYLDLVGAQGRRVPHATLPALLDLVARHKSDEDLRRAVRRVMGERGRWLAARNKRWQPLLEAGVLPTPAPSAQEIRRAEEQALAAMRSRTSIFSTDISQSLASCRNTWSSSLAQAVWQRLAHEITANGNTYALQSLYPLLRYLPLNQLDRWITELQRLAQAGHGGLDNMIDRLATRRQLYQETLHDE